MEIVQAQPEDLAPILELQKVCYRENALRYNDFSIAPLTQTLAEFEKEYKSSLVLKAVEQSAIVGSIRASQKDGTCFIGRLIVHPDHQNRGIGKQLMIAVEKSFPAVDRFVLFTGHKDEKNLYFYDKSGYKPFRQEQIRDDFYLVFLEKRIH
jgi:Predicted acetyltransferase